MNTGEQLNTLSELLKESKCVVTFDPYRDITKGCGQHCIGMNKNANHLCENHLEAVKRGDWFFKGGDVSRLIEELSIKIKELEKQLLEKQINELAELQPTWRAGSDIEPQLVGYLHWTIGNDYPQFTTRAPQCIFGDTSNIEIVELHPVGTIKKIKELMKKKEVTHE